MNLCLRIPWPNERWPFAAVHFCRWGSQYHSSPFLHVHPHRHVYKFGVGVGRVVNSFYKVSKRDPRWHPSGHWKWFYFNGRWK